MSARWISFAVVIVSLSGYHIAQRSMPEAAKPAPLFAFVYAVATVAMFATMAWSQVFGDGALGRVADVPKVATHWAPWVLVAAVCGIELGIFAMYRSGWSVTSASTVTQAVVAAVLVIVGTVIFREHITPMRLAGLAMCVVGAGLVAR